MAHVKHPGSRIHWTHSFLPPWAVFHLFGFSLVASLQRSTPFMDLCRFFQRLPRHWRRKMDALSVCRSRSKRRRGIPVAIATSGIKGIVPGTEMDLTRTGQTGTSMTVPLDQRGSGAVARL